MALPPVYINFQPPAIEAGNLNEVNQVIYQLLGDGVNPPINDSDIRANLGLGTMATQNANAVAVTGGAISGLSSPLPVASGGTGLAIAPPVFSAFRNASVALPGGVVTEVVANQVEFDTLGAFNTATGRYTPTVAGYYQIDVTVSIATTAGFSLNFQGYILKNGAVYKRGTMLVTTSTDLNVLASSLSSVVFLNGTTDFVSIGVFGTLSAGTQVVTGGVTGTETWINGHFIRS